MKSKTSKISGLSIVEILIVLAIVVLVASTQLPQIRSSLTTEGISVASTAGELDSAVRLARAQWFSNGQSGSVQIKGFADGRVWSGNKGWPIGHNIASAPQNISADNCASVWNAVMSEDAPRASAEQPELWKAQRGDQYSCQYVAQLGEQMHVITYNTRSGKVTYR